MENAGPGNGKRKPILVIGGGIAGMTAAIEAAEAGCEVVLVEKSPSLGGRVARFHQYFPKLCPPACGLEINFQRLKKNPRIKVLTQAEVESISGQRGDYEVVLNLAPRYVTPACTLCDACTPACPVELPDEFNCGLTKTKAVHLPHPMAYPAQYVIERSACPGPCHACADACSYGAINLYQVAQEKTVPAAAIVVATGWSPYDAAKLDNLGFGKYANVVTNVILERLAATNGPTQGKILRPSDGKEPRSVAFVQCAGSRDQNHLPYCSGVCCTASLKHASYLRTLYPQAQITVFYIDVRTPGQLEEFAAAIKALGGIELIKGKVGKIEEDSASGDLLVTAEDVLHGTKITRRYDLVVLATGIVPQTAGLPAKLHRDEFGFITNNTGIYGAGCAKRPAEVSASIRDATGAALKALQAAVGATHG
jgi:quinone-modifying oxidoreductase subunit QmoA